MGDKKLAKKFIKYRDNPKNFHKCFDDFFKHVGVKKKHRSDFLIASILKQVREIEDNTSHLTEAQYKLLSFMMMEAMTTNPPEEYDEIEAQFIKDVQTMSDEEAIKQLEKEMK